MRTLWSGVEVATAAESTAAERERRRDLVDTLALVVRRRTAAPGDVEVAESGLRENLLWLTDGDECWVMLAHEHVLAGVSARDALLMAELGVTG